MSKSLDIKRALIEALGSNPNLPITAEVVSIQGRTCTVKLVSELVLSDVRLCATINNEDDTLIIVPKIGSEVVMICQTGKLSSLMVIKVDAVERIEYKKGTFEFIIDGIDGKVTLKKGSVNFGKSITQLIEVIKALVIMTPAGPGSLSPEGINALESISLDFKTILNNI